MFLLKTLNTLGRDFMYNQFCKNLENFIKLNEGHNNVRVKIAKELLPLTDIALYNMHKDKQDDEYIRSSNLIYHLSKYNKIYSSLDKFLWELWAYGFDALPTENFSIESKLFLDEKAKLTDLMLSTHYFYP